MTDEKRPLLLCLDLEAGSEELALYAAQYVRSMDRTLHVLYVLPERSTETEEAALKRLKDLTDRTLAGVKPGPLVVRRGGVEEQIVDYVKKEGVDIVILGHRHRATRERIYVGSTVRTVISLAPGPVLVVPIDREESDR